MILQYFILFQYLIFFPNPYPWLSTDYRAPLAMKAAVRSCTWKKSLSVTQGAGKRGWKSHPWLHRQPTRECLSRSPKRTAPVENRAHLSGSRKEWKSSSSLVYANSGTSRRRGQPLAWHLLS